MKFKNWRIAGAAVFTAVCLVGVGALTGCSTVRLPVPAPTAASERPTPTSAPLPDRSVPLQAALAAGHCKVVVVIQDQTIRASAQVYVKANDAPTKNCSRRKIDIIIAVQTDQGVPGSMWHQRFVIYYGPS